jgi:AraC family transcriptional regulator
MRTATEEDYKERILRVLLHIQNHLDEAVSLDELAEIAHFSPFHFHRVFRGMVGEGVMEFCRRLRLERAAWLLKNSGDAVTTIAFGAGYETLDAFIRAFRLRFGVTPTLYRKGNAYRAPGPVSAISYSPISDGLDFEPYHTGEDAMDVTLRTLPPMKVVFVRTVGPYAESAGKAWGKLCGWAGMRGLMKGQPKFVGISHDDPEITPPEKVRYDACLVIEREVQPEGEIGVQEVGGGEYAVAVHRGPYEKMSETYAYLCGQWVPQNGWKLRTQPSLEFYLNDPNQTKPEELLTEICLPVER